MFKRRFFGRKISSLFLVGLLYCSSIHGLSAQNYPVQVSVNLGIPYATRLESFGTESEKISITLLHKDFATPSTEVYLQMRIEGPGLTIETTVGFKHSSGILLNAGIPELLGGSDLQYLFQPNQYNIQGIDKSSFLASGTRLPQGLYRFSFRAYDYQTGLAVSNWGSFMTQISGHLPPIINAPMDESELAVTSPQYVLIQFTPRHSTSQNLTGNIRYKVRLIEVIPANRNPNEAMQGVDIPFFETYTDQTSVVIGPTDPTLVDGRRYALQVQAIDVNGKDFFENQGYSQVVSFVYGKKCPIPDSLVYLDLQSNAVELHWKENSMYRGFEVKTKPIKSHAVQTEMVFRNGVRISNLKPGTAYLSSIKGICAESISREIGIKFITDTLKGAYQKWANQSCGKPLPTIDLKNRAPLAALEAGDVVKAADFEVRVLSAFGSEGVFSGNGTVLLPYTGKIPIPCSFSNIQINTDYRLIEGKIQVLRKPLELSNRTITKVTGTFNQRYGANWNQLKRTAYSGQIDAVILNNRNQIQVDGSAGESVYPVGQNYEITDAKGNRWYVSKNGTVTKSEGTKGKPFVSNPQTGEGAPSALKTGYPLVFFAAETAGGYDAFAVKNLTAGSEYETLSSLDTAYYVGWKLLKTGQTDTIHAFFVQGKKTKVLEDSVRFARSDGTEVQAIVVEGEFRIGLTGHTHLQADALWAYYWNSQNFGEPQRVVLGKINLISVDNRLTHVVLVPVNELGGAVNAPSVSKELNQLMHAQGLGFSVQLAKPLTVSTYASNKPIKVDRSMLGTAYGNDLAQMIDAFERRYPWMAYNQTQDTAWFFILGKSADNEAGYMALNRNYGFLFLNGAAQFSAHTIAHELGHGIFNLEHSFTNTIEAGETQNLMDYSSPFSLLHYNQWKQVFDPDGAAVRRQRLSQTSESGKFFMANYYQLWSLGIPKEEDSVCFVAPNGSIITLPNDSQTCVAFGRAFRSSGSFKLSGSAGKCNGVITRFKLNGKEYTARAWGNKFDAFYTDDRIKDSLLLSRLFSKSSGLQKVYAGYEKDNCVLAIKTGNYRNSNATDTMIALVKLTNEEEVLQVYETEDCLEYFNEDELSPDAKAWWEAAKKNVNFNANQNAVKRIVRLIHDLGADYKYFNYLQYEKLIESRKIGLIPSFAKPENPFDSVVLWSFENYLRNAQLGLAEQNEAVAQLKSSEAAMEFMMSLPEKYLKWFNIKNRMRLLRILANEGLHEISWSGWLDRGGTEALALKLLQTTPEEQVTELLDSLVRPASILGEAHILAALCENVSGFDAENYFQFTNWLTAQLFKNKPVRDDFSFTQAFEEHKFLNFSSGFWGAGLSNWFTDNGLVYLKSARFSVFYAQELEVHPYDWLYLKFTDGFKYQEQNFPENSTLKVPAVLVYAMFEAENTKKLVSTGKVVFDAALLAVGVGEIRAMVAGASGMRKAWLVSRGIVDIGLSLGDLVITAGLGEALDETVPGRAFLEDWNKLQLYYGIGSIAEAGLSAIVRNLYKNADDVSALGKLDVEEVSEIEKLLDEVELKTGVLQTKNLKLLAGKLSKGKNLLQLEAPVGKFRQLVDENKRFYRASDLWKKETAEMEHYLTKDAKHYIKRDPSSGATLFMDVEKNDFIGFYLDEGQVFTGDYEKLATTMRTVHGLPGGLKYISVGNVTIDLSSAEINIILGRFDPKALDPDEIGTLDVINQIELLRNYSYSSKAYELSPGCVHILNMPEGYDKMAGAKDLNFWDAFNKEFLDIAIQNKEKVNIVLVTDPRKYKLLAIIEGGELTTKPTYFARELKYLKDSGIVNVKLSSGETISLNEINLKYLKFND